MEQLLNGWYLVLTEVNNCVFEGKCLDNRMQLQTTDVGKRRVKEDDAAVRRIETCITNWINQFQADDKLCHLASGRNATSDISLTFWEHMQRGGSCQHYFYAPVARMKLKTFKSLDVSKTSKKQTAVLRSTHELFWTCLVN